MTTEDKTELQSFKAVLSQALFLVGNIKVMLSKRSLGCDLVEMSTAKRFRFNIADLFLRNEVSGTRAASIYRDAGDAGAKGVADLRRLGSKKHVHRNLLTKLLEKLQVAETIHVPSAGMEPTQGGGRSL